MSLKRKNKKSKFIFGALIGAGLGVLFAPKKGSETRKALKVKIDAALVELENVDVEEVRKTIETKIDELQVALKDVDKENALEEAKKQGKILLKKADELLKYAVEKGTPILEEMVKDIKKETTVVLKEVITKLEEK